MSDGHCQSALQTPRQPVPQRRCNTSITYPIRPALAVAVLRRGWFIPAAISSVGPNKLFDPMMPEDSGQIEI
jgi:hypothetical protein